MSHRPSVAPKAPLKKLDKVGAGFSSWEDEQKHEAAVRKAAGDAELGSGYTHFSRKNDTEEAAQRKIQKMIESRTRPDDKEYFIPKATFAGWKFDYIFTTREGRGTGYFWDGMDSIKKLKGELKDEPKSKGDNDHDSKQSTGKRSNNNVDDSKEKDEKSNHPKKKKKRKKNAGPIIVEDPNNPLEQVSRIIQQRNQALDQTPLPAGWEAAVDPTSRKTYYFQRATGKRSWEKPALEDSSELSGQSQDDLPDGWKAAKDASSGKTYYYHTNGTTVWEKPTK